MGNLKVSRRYWNLKEEMLDCTPWRTRVGRGYEPIVNQYVIMMIMTTVMMMMMMMIIIIMIRQS